MHSTTLLIAASVLLSATALAAWAWFAMARVEAELRNFSGFEGIHFEIGPQAAVNPESARWSTPG